MDPTKDLTVDDLLDGDLSFEDDDDDNDQDQDTNGWWDGGWAGSWDDGWDDETPEDKVKRLLAEKEALTQIIKKQKSKLWKWIKKHVALKENSLTREQVQEMIDWLERERVQRWVLSQKYEDFEENYEEISKLSKAKWLSLEESYWIVWGKNSSDPSKQGQGWVTTWGSFREVWVTKQIDEEVSNILSKWPSISVPQSK